MSIKSKKYKLIFFLVFLLGFLGTALVSNKTLTKTKANNTDASFEIPVNLSFREGGYGRDEGVRFADVNADGLVDIVRAKGNSYSSRTYLNTGQSWELSESFKPPLQFVDRKGNSNGVKLVDINGDNLPDFIRAVYEFAGHNYPYEVDNELVYINNGFGWQKVSDWRIPVGFNLSGVNALVDVNGDGLVDIVENFAEKRTSNIQEKINKTYLNNGQGWDLSFYCSTIYNNSVTQYEGEDCPVT